MKSPDQNLPSTLVRKACEDAAFRRGLLANPKEALRSLGAALPKDVELKVVEETPARWYLVLPAATGGEIPDAQLDAVAGGLAYPTGLSAYSGMVASKLGAGGVPGTSRPIGPVSAGGVPG